MQQHDASDEEAGRGAQRWAAAPDFGPASEDAVWYARRWLPLVSQYYPPLLDQLWLSPGDAVLDVACGPGALVGEIAPLVGPFGRVIGIDWSAPMLHAGLRLARRHDVRHVAFVLGDMCATPFADATFDVAACVLGLGGGDGPRLALSEIRRLLRPGGRTAIVTPGPAVRSPASGLLLDALARHGVTSGHAAGYEGEQPETIERWLRAAGFERTGSRTLDAVLKRIDFDDFWADVYAGRLPGSALYRTQPAQLQAAVRAEVREAVTAFSSGPRLLLPAEVVLAWGTA
jgi:ubiquinone/menaquinone biosynthesis C-methylase UbiE